MKRTYGNGAGAPIPEHLRRYEPTYRNGRAVLTANTRTSHDRVKRYQRYREAARINNNRAIAENGVINEDIFRRVMTPRHVSASVLQNLVRRKYIMRRKLRQISNRKAASKIMARKTTRVLGDIVAKYL